MKRKIYRTVFWAALICGFISIVLFTKTQAWGAVLSTGFFALVALLASQGGGIYENE